MKRDLYALAAGRDVVHVFEERTREPAVMKASAVVQPDGTLVYAVAPPP